MRGWWCVRFGDALAWVEAASGPAAVRRSLELAPLGDWTDDMRELAVVPQDAYPDNAGPHDYTRAVLNANPPPLQRHRARTRRRQSRLAVAYLAGLLAFGLVHSASAETWRSLPALGSPGCVILDTRSDPVADALEWDRSAQCSPCFPSTWSCLVPCSV